MLLRSGADLVAATLELEFRMLDVSTDRNLEHQYYEVTILLCTTRGHASPMAGNIGGAQNNGCMAPKTKIRRR